MGRFLLEAPRAGPLESELESERKHVVFALDILSLARGRVTAALTLWSTSDLLSLGTQQVAIKGC